VTAYQGKVLLVGQSPNSELSARAKQIAMGVEGTTEVYNEIRQGQPIGLGTASNDTWITTKVRSQLLTSDQVKSSNVKVTTENGEVFLLGLVSSEAVLAQHMRCCSEPPNGQGLALYGSVMHS
ncbi:BON domain-containing protein, partial [Aeromonas veronii]|uniref:BON domain-containing protein n=1 Tax=Aeromonas veronii TaxID=654 RepID=UPI00406D4694